MRDRILRFAPAPRLVDWGILVLVLAETVTGVLSLGAGAPPAWLLFDVHAVLGLALAGLLVFKFARVWRRVARVDRWDRAVPVSVLLAVVAVAAVATGVVWVLGGDVRVAFWTLMNVHVGLGLALVPLVLLHLTARFRTPSRADFEGRRTALQFTALFVGGAAVWRLQSAVNDLFGTAGTTRRFTGSKPVDALAGRDRGDGDSDDATRDGVDPADGTSGDAGDGESVGGDFPVTSWVADDPDPIDTSSWGLRVEGRVERRLTLGYEDLVGDVDDDPAFEPLVARALLDCTSGWYTVQDWRGVRLGDLLDVVGILDDARWVRVTSVTGYRWSYPIEQARDYLLATHVGGDPLSHGHGAPLRLVAPDRRGFQWVKWVTRIEVRSRPDYGQYLATLVSGFDGDGRG